MNNPKQHPPGPIFEQKIRQSKEKGIFSFFLRKKDPIF